MAVPAYGDNWAADKAQQPTVASPDWFERAAAAAVRKQDVSTHANARERAFGVAISQTPTGFDARSDGMNRLYGLGEYANPIDARERGLVVSKTTPQSQPQGFDARSDGMNRLYGSAEYAAPVVADFDRFQIVPSNEPVTVSATSSSRESSGRRSATGSESHSSSCWASGSR